jgi:hypothetical protein
MINWCINMLYISHISNEEINKIKDGFLNRNVVEKFIPTPIHLYQDEERLYEWRKINWGTKWDLEVDDESDIMIISDNQILISFCSAWRPPIQIFKKWNQLGFDIKVYFVEPGFKTCGKYENGTLNRYDLQEEFENIPQDLIDELDLSDIFKN